ncbi:MAG: hypothetical protein CL917_02900 [Deltaproteobacteria bacterium]|nr:hypothetical protein [Deltaproteobacteria bacterium]
MRKRIDFNVNSPAVSVPGTVLHEMCSHALDAVPEECCGLITGSPEAPFGRVSRITNVMNKMHLNNPNQYPRDARVGYYMAEVEYLSALSQAEARGESVTGVYHSHVDAGAYLSGEDLAYAENPLFPFPGAFQIVLGVTAGRIKEVAYFGVDRESGGFLDDCGRLIEVIEE